MKVLLQNYLLIHVYQYKVYQNYCNLAYDTIVNSTLSKVLLPLLLLLLPTYTTTTPTYTTTTPTSTTTIYFYYYHAYFYYYHI